jgi:8-oxo-dGTP pyrophosphatase MutT (NUDIX family)
METGRADTLAETPFQTARREAKEEIGLPEIGQPLPRPFSVEHLCELPANLAKTEVVVRPCVALLHSYDSATGMNADPEVSLIPQLDAREVAAVFTAPFHSFLHLKQDGRDSEDWYRGSWSRWHNSNWRSRLNPLSLSLSHCPCHTRRSPLKVQSTP